MTTNVIPMFTFNGTQLRGIKIDGEPWFAVADACRILGIYQNSKSGTTKIKAQMDADEVRLADLLTPHPRWEGKTLVRSVLMLSRPGLFKLIARSDKPEAREFDRWVRHEVLPH